MVLKSQNISPSETVVRAWKPKMSHSSIQVYKWNNIIQVQTWPVYYAQKHLSKTSNDLHSNFSAMYIIAEQINFQWNDVET